MPHFMTIIATPSSSRRIIRLKYVQDSNSSACAVQAPAAPLSETNYPNTTNASLCGRHHPTPRLPAATRNGTAYDSDAPQVSHHLDYSATVYSTLDNYSGRVSDYFPFQSSKPQSVRSLDSNSNPRDCHHSDTAVILWKCQGKCRRSKNKAGAQVAQANALAKVGGLKCRVHRGVLYSPSHSLCFDLAPASVC